MRKPLVSVAPLGVCLLLGACFGGLKNDVPAPVNYRISAPKIAPGAALAADILVSVQATAPGLDGTGIAARFPGSRIDYLAGARWPVRTPALIESALIEALQDSGRLRSVQGDFGRFRTTHTLTLEVRRFEADYTAGEPPVAQVALAVTIGRQSDRSVLAAFTVAAEERASENRISAVVAALDAAFARAATDIATRSLDTIAADLARATLGQAEAGQPHAPWLRTSDIERVAGLPWTGTLTYLDYAANKNVSIPSVLIVTKSQPDGFRRTFEYLYPEEPNANGLESVVIGDGGRTINGEWVIERVERPGNELRWVTGKQAMENDRNAKIRGSSLNAIGTAGTGSIQGVACGDYALANNGP